MNLFAKLRVSHRLYLVYGIIVLFSLAIYLMLSVFLTGLERTNVLVFDKEVKARILTQSITADLNMVSRLSRNLMLGSDFEKNLARIRENEQTIRASFDELPAALAGSEEIALADASRRSTLAFVAKVLELAEEMRPMAAEQRHQIFERYEREATPPAQESRKHFDALSRLAQEQYQRAEADARRQFGRLRTTLNVAMPAFILVVTVVLLAILRSITQPLHALGNALSDVAAGEGDLTRRLELRDTHELGRIAEGFNGFAESIRSMIGRVHQHSSEAVTAAFHLEQDAEAALERVEESAAQTASLASATYEMATTTRSVAESCAHAAERSRRASQTAHQGAEVVQRTIGLLHQVTDRVEGTARKVEDLGRRSNQIGAIVGTIREIADQTNLLALNAAIEAARAGEQGRGFAVVADEVRALAGRTNTATREIGAMIQAIQQETAGVVATMQEGVGEAQRGSAEAARSGEALESILAGAAEVAQEIDQIATAIEELTATNNEISNGVTRIDSITQASLDLTRRTEQTSAHIIQVFDGMQESLSRFRADTDISAVLSKAKIAHLVFVRNVRQHIAGEKTLAAEAVPDDRSCAFGLWYQSSGLERFGSSPVFREIEGHHRQVHEMAKRAVEAANVRRTEQAKSHYQDMLAASDQLQSLLDQVAA
jgi:methyl-accepting chemotaxis protein